MPTRHRCAALAALSAAALAPAELTSVFSTTALSAFASLEHEGLMNAGDDFFDFILLDQLGSMNETRLSQAVIPTANGSAETTSVATFDASADEAALFFDISASAAYEAGANDTFAFLRSRTANITRFTTDEQVRVTLTGNASLEFDLNFQTTPRLPQTVLSIITEPGDGDPLFEVENIEGAFAFEIVLGPGSYQLRSAVDDTIQTFGFPAGVYSASSELVLTATITTIPSPGAALLFGAPLVRRRRRVAAPVAA